MFTLTLCTCVGLCLVTSSCWFTQDGLIYTDGQNVRRMNTVGRSVRMDKRGNRVKGVVTSVPSGLVYLWAKRCVLHVGR